MKHILYLSFGKDSMAALIKVVELGLPLDAVVCARIWYDENTPAEHPVQAAFIERATEIIKRKFGIDVIFVRSKWTFKSYFYRTKQKGNHVGDNYGFPFVMGAWCVSRLKQEAFAQARRMFKGEKIIEYVGIAFDEQSRIMNDPNKRYLLNELKIIEDDCFDICERHGLLSPKYEKSFRDGCWFCPKQPLSSLYDLWRDYPRLFNELKQLQPDSFNTFKPRESIFDIEQRFKLGYIPKRKLRPKYVQLRMAGVDA